MVKRMNSELLARSQAFEKASAADSAKVADRRDYSSDFAVGWGTTAAYVQ